MILRNHAASVITGLAIGFVAGLMLPRGSPEHPRSDQRPSPREIEIEWRRGDGAEARPQKSTLTDDAAPEAPPETDTGQRAPGVEMIRGTYPVAVQTEEDVPFEKFAVAILPTVEQVRRLVQLPEREYAALQVSAHVGALKAILGDQFDAGREDEVKRFIDEWACKKHRSHRDYAARVDGATATSPQGQQLDEEVARIARDWASTYAALKLEKRSWLARTFPRDSFAAYEEALGRLGKHSEVAATFRDKN